MISQNFFHIVQNFLKFHKISSGYEGDGQTCTFSGPCHVANGGCHPMAMCISNGAAGLVQCFCRPGFTGKII